MIKNCSALKIDFCRVELPVTKFRVQSFGSKKSLSQKRACFACSSVSAGIVITRFVSLPREFCSLEKAFKKATAQFDKTVPLLRGRNSFFLPPILTEEPAAVIITAIFFAVELLEFFVVVKVVISIHFIVCRIVNVVFILAVRIAFCRR